MSISKQFNNISKALLSINKLSKNHVRNVKRWVAPTLREHKNRTDCLIEDVNYRSHFSEWNYRAEIFAFGKRLNEEFQMPLLRAAFSERSYINQEKNRERNLGINESSTNIIDNDDLAEKGIDLIDQYCEIFLTYSLPLIPEVDRAKILNFVKSVDSLANVALHLGVKDLVVSTEYPPSKYSLCKCLQAVIGALCESSGHESAYQFIRDIICTQLNQANIIEILSITEPFKELYKYCEYHEFDKPEPRLIGDTSKNTVTSTFLIGVYSNKQLLGKGFGENIAEAIDAASINALENIYVLGDNMRPINFKFISQI